MNATNIRYSAYLVNTLQSHVEWGYVIMRTTLVNEERAKKNVCRTLSQQVFECQRPMKFEVTKLGAQTEVAANHIV